VAGQRSRAGSVGRTPVRLKRETIAAASPALADPGMPGSAVAERSPAVTVVADDAERTSARTTLRVAVAAPDLGDGPDPGATPADASPPPTAIAAAQTVVSRPPAAVVTPSAAGSKTAAAATDPITAFFTSIGGFFFNQSPTLNPVQLGQSPYGVVTGRLDAVDPDSTPLVYSVLTEPQLGVVSVGADGGYSFVPDPVAAREGFVDSFVVEVSDAETGFHFHGLMSLLNVLTFGLAGRDPHRTTATVAVTVTPVNFVPTATVVVGDPDPSSGVVTGAVVGEDGDGDPLSYSGSGVTSKGEVVVASSGGFVYSPSAEARHVAASLVATDADRADTFIVGGDRPGQYGADRFGGGGCP